MHNLFANAGDLTFDSDGWISFWHSIHDLESTWPETTGEVLGLFLSLGKSFTRAFVYKSILYAAYVGRDSKDISKDI